MDGNNEFKLERVERLLRARRGTELSAGFRRGIMDSIAQLPEPEQIAPPRAASGLRQFVRLLSTGEKVGAVLVLGALVLPFVPGAGDWLATLEYSLATSELSLSLGDTVLSASMLTVVAAGICAGLLAAGGAYGARHRLLGA
jgi:hypothetical protein